MGKAPITLSESAWRGDGTRGEHQWKGTQGTGRDFPWQLLRRLLLEGRLLGGRHFARDEARGLAARGRRDAPPVAHPRLVPDLTFVPILDKPFQTVENRRICWKFEDRDALASMLNGWAARNHHAYE